MSARERMLGDDEARELGIGDDRRTALATMGLGALLVVLGVVTLIDALGMPDSDETVGPAAAPLLVGCLLLLVGAGLAVQGRRAMGVWEVSEHVSRVQAMRLLAVLVVLVVFAAVVPYLGYVASSTLLFAVTAVLLGSPHRLRAIAYGWVLAVTVFLLFDTLIGITLPAGPWGF